MRRTLVLFAIVSLAAWLGCPGVVGAQTLSQGEEPLPPRCAPAVRSALPALGAGEGDELACARVGGEALGVRVERLEATGAGAMGDDVRVRLVTARGELTVTLNAERVRHGHPSLGWIDTLETQVLPVEGAPSLVRVSVVARRGEDYSSAEETHIVVDPRGARPAVRWAGRGDFRQSDYTVCERLRTTTVRVEGGVLRVRSRVSRVVSPRSGGVSPRLHATLARECRAPEAVTVDFVL